MIHGLPSEDTSNFLHKLAQEAIEASIARKHRCLFALPGDDCESTVTILQQVLQEALAGARPSIDILWCTKNEQTARRRAQAQKLKNVDKRKSPSPDIRIRYCQYRDTVHILGNTYDMVILDDFEAISPNFMARVVETANGGGVVAIMLPMFSSFACVENCINGMAFSTGGKPMKPFLRRVVASLERCRHVQWLSVAPCLRRKGRMDEVKSLTGADMQRESLTERYTARRDAVASAHENTIRPLCDVTSTIDQGMALLALARTIFENAVQSHEAGKCLTTQVNITAGRGRGKSAVLGLAIALALHVDRTQVFVLAPSLSNVKTLFEFIVKGLLAIDARERRDFEKVYGQREEESSCIRLIRFRGRKKRQTVEYISPEKAVALTSAPMRADYSSCLWVVDEAAALPVALVQDIIRIAPLRFLSSTVFGYEGSGRSLVLKVLKLGHSGRTIEGSLSQESAHQLSPERSPPRSEHISLSEPIRYAANDPIEEWMSELFCFPSDGVTPTPHKSDDALNSTKPPPKDCQLFHVDKTALFSFTSHGETYLWKIMHILFHAHYRNQPDDLQVLCDSPNHHLFVLMGGNAYTDEDGGATPQGDVLCVIQAVEEGGIDPQRAARDLQAGIKPAGDMMPYAMYQSYEDTRLVSSRGLRVIRIAVHPDLQGCGYGSRALSAFVKHIADFDLCAKSEGAATDSGIIRHCANLPIFNTVRYVGAMFGVTAELFNFWTRQQFFPVYLRQQCSTMTGAHSILMIRPIGRKNISEPDDVPFLSDALLEAIRFEFRRRYISLVPSVFRDIPIPLSAALLGASSARCMKIPHQKALILGELTMGDFTRFESFVEGSSSIEKIFDLIPRLAKLYFTGALDGIIEMLALTDLQRQTLLSVGLHGHGWSPIDGPSVSSNSLIEETRECLPLREAIGVLTRSLRHVRQGDTNFQAV
ncbi:hypothetical protein XU18_1641 [Perkinsela sp. CCAP 1560/4]|nr:hypothetical protein XU18_1641 [Perkinsela sp. CCAP 1560/4]|eukprot:KNH07750.1 hypothetical protein XU18_1641 [Perkinsela sp. CCAP 1560/4]